jgi:hypothetical protein
MYTLELHFLGLFQSFTPRLKVRGFGCVSVVCRSSPSSGSVTAEVQEQEIWTPHQQIRSVSGLVVKSIVAIDGPRVRFAADAFRNYIFSFHLPIVRRTPIHDGLPVFFLLHFPLRGANTLSFYFVRSGRTVDTFLSCPLPSRITPEFVPHGAPSLTSYASSARHCDHYSLVLASFHVLG